MLIKEKFITNSSTTTYFGYGAIGEYEGEIPEELDDAIEDIHYDTACIHIGKGTDDEKYLISIMMLGTQLEEYSSAYTFGEIYFSKPVTKELMDAQNLQKPPPEIEKQLDEIILLMLDKGLKITSMKKQWFIKTF